jgi:hypothetical protein
MACEHLRIVLDKKNAWAYSNEIGRRKLYCNSICLECGHKETMETLQPGSGINDKPELKVYTQIENDDVYITK